MRLPYAHLLNAQMLRVPAKIQGCQGYSILKKTSSRASRAVGRVFVDSSGPHPEKSTGRVAYTMLLIVNYDYSHMDFIFFVKTENEATAFCQPQRALELVAVCQEQ